MRIRTLDDTASSMVSKALAVLDGLVAARHHQCSLLATALRDADVALDQLKQLAHLALQLHWFRPGQYEHFSRLALEVGRLLGGWRRSLNSGARAAR
jgi:hypothetical protein